METIAALQSTAIPDILITTFQAFSPLLAANRTAITSVHSEKDIPYAAHPRQKLDIYHAAAPPRAPLLVYLYGGGLTRGDKAIPNTLAYANLGAFFATRGFTTIVADYRRVNDDALGTGEDAVYPAGAEDLHAVIVWLLDSPLLNKDASSAHAAPRDLFIMGNSAGGVHLATYLLHAAFAAQRAALRSPESKLRLRGAVLNSVPLDFAEQDPARVPVTNAYYPPATSPVAHFCPAGLLAEAILGSAGGGPTRLDLPEVLVLVGTREPAEIEGPVARWVRAWREGWGAEGLREGRMEGHNHISPPWALGSGDVEGERWGEELVVWMRGLSV